MLIIYNPMAGRRRRRHLAAALRALRAAGIALELAETTGPGDATLIARAAVARGLRLVVAAGGDGTLAEVAAGLNGSDAALGLLPLGTANVFAHELGLPIAPEGAAGVLLQGRTAPVFPGMAEAAQGTRLFMQMVGAGFDAAVVHGLDAGWKRRFGKLAYVAESARRMTRYGFAPFEITLDGGAPMTARSVIISKGRFYAGRFRALPGASPLAPGFSVLSFRHGGVLTAMAAGAALPLHQLHRLPGATLYRAAEVALRATGVPLQADGDAAGSLPIRVTDARHPIRFILP